MLFSFLLSTYTHDDVTQKGESATNPEYFHYNVPSDYPTIQSALDAAVADGERDATILVEEGEYREMVLATGLKNLILIGKNARILPPPDYEFTDPPLGDNYPPSSFTLINCENFKVEGFTFVGDDFAEGSRDSYPMGSSILSYNSSGTISNNIVFNYLDGICFQVDDPKWMKGDITDNYIHNCWWSGILATGSHNLRIQKNKIAFTFPKEYSISVGIWTDGGTGIIAENHISSYKDIDYKPAEEIISGIELLPAYYQYTERMNYRVMDNTFEHAANIRATDIQFSNEKQNDFIRKSLRVNNHFININQHNNNYHYSSVVILQQ